VFLTHFQTPGCIPWLLHLVYLLCTAPCKHSTDRVLLRVEESQAYAARLGLLCCVLPDSRFAVSGAAASSMTRCDTLWQCTDDSNYVGDYQRGKRHGYGVYSFPNGDQYLARVRG